MATQPSKGKYKFNTFANLTVTTEHNNIGLPLKSALYHFNIGDVIDVQKMFFNDKGEGWEAQVSAITEQNRAVPFSVLTKVADTTPITANISRTEQTFSGSTEGRSGGSNPTTQTTDNTTTDNTTTKNIFTSKNIIISVIAIGAILGLLKWRKVI